MLIWHAGGSRITMESLDRFLLWVSNDSQQAISNVHDLEKKVKWIKTVKQYWRWTRINPTSLKFSRFNINIEPTAILLKWPNLCKQNIISFPCDIGISTQLASYNRMLNSSLLVVMPVPRLHGKYVCTTIPKHAVAKFIISRMSFDCRSVTKRWKEKSRINKKLYYSLILPQPPA